MEAMPVGGLDTIDPDVVAALDDVGSSVTRCEDLLAAVKRHQLRADVFLTDDDTLDRELQQLLSEMQLSVSRATISCAAGDSDESAALLAEVGTLTALIAERSSALQS